MSSRRPAVSNRVPILNTVRPQLFCDFHLFIWNHLRLISGSFRAFDFLIIFLSQDRIRKKTYTNPFNIVHLFRNASFLRFIVVILYLYDTDIRWWMHLFWCFPGSRRSGWAWFSFFGRPHVSQKKHPSDNWQCAQDGGVVNQMLGNRVDRGVCQAPYKKKTKLSA